MEWWKEACGSGAFLPSPTAWVNDIPWVWTLRVGLAWMNEPTGATRPKKFAAGSHDSGIEKSEKNRGFREHGRFELSVETLGIAATTLGQIYRIISAVPLTRIHQHPAARPSRMRSRATTTTLTAMGS